MAQSGYVGKAGHLAAMAEFLLRGYNVAMPEVDVGDDIFVVHDRQGRLWRIQVKTAIGKRRRYGYSGKFAVPLGQLRTLKKPDLFYVLAMPVGDRWEFVIILRETLRDLHEKAGIGHVVTDDLILNCRLTAARALCSGADLQAFRNNWDEWPVIRP
jgi:hypothetical protein